VSFATIILRIASQRVFIVAVYFVIDPVRKILDTPSMHLVQRTHNVQGYKLRFIMNYYRY